MSDGGRSRGVEGGEERRGEERRESIKNLHET
jgi:hypothetical protein